MKDIKKIYIMNFAFLFLLAGCELVGSVDDIEPKYVQTDETVITNARTAELALNGIYKAWQSQYIGWMVAYNSIRSGTLLQSDAFAYTEGFDTNEVKIDNFGLKEYYTVVYSIINTTNSFLTNLEKANPKDLTPERKKEMIGEAKFFRAAAHFELLRHFGEFYDVSSAYGVVTYDFPERTNTPMKRATVAETYDFIIKDLQAAVADAPTMVQKHYYVGQTTAEGLLAKVYLCKGDFVNASKWAEKVTAEAAAKGYALEANYLDIFTKRFNSSEVLWAPEILMLSAAGDVIAPVYALKKGSSLGIVADELVAGEGSMETGEGYDPRYVSAYPDHAEGILKYPILDDKIKGEPDNTYFFLRLAEVYLTAAEAEFRSPAGDKTKAREYFQTIATRAGYAEDYVSTISDSDFLQTLFKHKYIELSNEGEEWFDLVRFKILDGMQIAPRYAGNDRNLTLPIPKSAIVGNNLLEQNPSYKQ